MTLENAWKEAARHWWERLNEARGEARMWQQATAHACRSVELREKETEAFRATNHELSLARDKAENERDIANTQRDIAVEELKEALEERDELAPLAARIAEADRKHPRDIADGMPLEEDASVYLERARALLNRRSTWLRALLCEVAEARYELVIGNTDRLADELLDVATVALRWRRAILERTKTGE